MALQCKILPNHYNDIFRVINLALEAKEALDEEIEQDSDDHNGKQIQTNPMKSIEYQELFLSQLRDKYDVMYTIGGYLEDRSQLWSGFEANSVKMLHLGVDINNLDIGDPVSVPCDVTVVHAFKDTLPMNGWGGRLIFKMDEPYLGADYLLYGHLSHDLPEVGTEFKKGDIVGKIGDCTVNGGWFIHLHVQLVKKAMFGKCINDLRLIDGYLLDHDEMTPDEVSADPIDLICYDAFSGF